MGWCGYARKSGFWSEINLAPMPMHYFFATQLTSCIGNRLLSHTLALAVRSVPREPTRSPALDLLTGTGHQRGVANREGRDTLAPYARTGVREVQVSDTLPKSDILKNEA